MLADIANRIRAERGLTSEVPDFDPNNGNEQAKYLFLLEAPGAKAVKSGFISLDNPDQTAANFRQFLEEAGIDRSEIALWNIVPWYIGNKQFSKIRAAKGSDVAMGCTYVRDICKEIKNLKAIILVGSAARKAHVHLSTFCDCRIYSIHHPSPRVMNSSERRNENLQALKFIKENFSEPDARLAHG
ncbi:MAG: uracil-DNA glycosylase [Planctomycetes bacterium]|nr:uracil-DNA glycosylase [Planctomycetota bacterium]